jgi:hypothetical protein
MNQLTKLVKNRHVKIIIILSLVIAVQIIVLATKQGLIFKTKNLEAYARQVFEICASENYPPSCYDKEIPKLMDVLTMEQAFEVTKLVQQKDPNYWYCHVLGHNLSAAEVSKNPENWKDVLARCPSGTCSNGCLHGGLQEKFRADVLTDEQIDQAVADIVDLCEERPDWKPTGLEQASCYHALGHLSMYISNADIQRSIKICDHASVRDDGRNFLQTCYEGAFMQIFQPLEPEDFALVERIAPEKDELESFCGLFEGEQKEACHREGWPLYREEILTSEGLVDYCSRGDQESERRCYNAMFYVITAQENFNQQKISTLCSGLPQEKKGQCFANSASRMIETDWQLADQSVKMCQRAEEFGVEDQCYQELVFYSTFNFHPGSTEALKLCRLLPDPYKSSCLRDNNI